MFIVNDGGNKMQNSFPYVDILIFGVIAIFLIFRLKNILGTKTGFEETNFNKKSHDKQTEKVVPLKSFKDDVNHMELNKILEVDPNFNVNDFLAGSKTFFEMVLKGFVSGNLDNIKNFTKPSVLKSFKDVINERNQIRKHILLIFIKENKIIKSTITKLSIKINVKFVSLQIRALIDKITR